MNSSSYALTPALLWTRFKPFLQGLFAGSDRRQLLISISSLAGSGLIAVVLRFIGGVVQGRFVGPETLGYYTQFTILPTYLFFLHLGVFTSLARQYPYYIGRKEPERALQFAANALGWTRMLCAFHALLFMVPCLWAVSRGHWPAALGWGTQSLVSAISLYMFYLGSTYRSGSEFVAWSKATLLSSVASLAFLPLVAFYQFAGVCARYSLPAFISMIYAHLRRPLRIKPRWQFPVLKQMIAFGAPLMVFAYIGTSLWTAVERTFILKMADERALGIFAFAGTLCVALVTVAGSISQVFHPRIAIRYGASSRNMQASFRYCLKCTLVGLAAMLPLVALTYWLVDPLVRVFLPKYVESVPIARWLLWLPLISMIDQPKHLLMVAKRTRLLAIAVLSGFGLFMVLLSCFYASGAALSLHGIVAASVLCKFITVLISNLLCWREASRPFGAKANGAA
jgi:O-antigen/teichoic acid export membrane protein